MEDESGLPEGVDFAWGRTTLTFPHWSQPHPFQPSADDPEVCGYTEEGEDLTTVCGWPEDSPYHERAA